MAGYNIVCVEPSAVMRAQRWAHLPPAINATADSLPFDDRSFDASMAILTVHHWKDAARGLAELRRVTRGPVLILTFDRDTVHEYWLAEYAPEVIESDRRRFQEMDFIIGPRIARHSPHGASCSRVMRTGS